MERHLGHRIQNNKKVEEGTGSESEQLLRRDVPLASENSIHGDQISNDKLVSVKSFVARTRRMPSRNADDDIERSLGHWIKKNKKVEGGTGSEHEQLLRREVPQVFK